jgi:hypothetical protein
VRWLDGTGDEEGRGDRSGVAININNAVGAETLMKDRKEDLGALGGKCMQHSSFLPSL